MTLSSSNEGKVVMEGATNAVRTDHGPLVLSRQAFEKFLCACNEPRKPTDALRKLLARLTTVAVEVSAMTRETSDANR